MGNEKVLNGVPGYGVIWGQNSVIWDIGNYDLKKKHFQKEKKISDV